jgi:phosphatidylglycerophosphatase A
MKSSISKKIAKGIATGFGSGLSPKAPGTCGTLAVFFISLVYLYVLGSPDFLARIIFAAGCIIVGIVSTRMILSDYPEEAGKDPQEIVIDEFAGYLVAVSVIPWTFLSLFAGFILFRIFDISKIGPIKSLEKLPGAWGIMLDDVGAGVFAGALLFFAAWHL